MKLALALLACAVFGSAATFDGDWNATSRQNQPFTLSLKTKNGKITGMVTMDGKKKPRYQTVQNATMEGDALTFTTVQNGKKASAAFTWKVMVDGDQMTGTRLKEGAKHGLAFTAHR